MAKRKKADGDEDGPPASSIVEAGGESPKKKKKKKKRKSEGQEEDERALLSSTLSSPGSSASPKKKKKKIIMEETQQWNGLKEGEAEEEEKTKKKKKKKKEKKEEEEEEEEVVKAVKVEEEGVTKKKKKKKKAVEEEEEAVRRKKEEEEQAMRIKEEEEKKAEKKKKKKKKQDPGSPTPTPAPASPHRPKQKRVMKEEEQEEEEEEEERGKEDILEWTREDTTDLLEKIAHQFPAPDKDVRSCRVTVKRVDWAAAAPPGHSPDDARDHFMALYKKINLYKNLTTVVAEMQKMVELGLKDRRNRPAFPINRFLKDFLTPEKRRAAQSKGENLFRLGHEAWKNLSDAQKAQYNQKYQEECARMQTIDDEKLEGPVKLPKTPHQLYIEVAKGRGRTPYTSLAPSDQVPYIRQALESIVRYQDNIAAHLTSDQDSSVKAYSTPTKGDLKTYLQAYGCPETPPLRPHNLYYWELVTQGELDDVPGTRKMMEALKRFKELSAAEKLKYKEKHAKKRAVYEAKIQEWRKGQDTATLLALKMYSTTAEAMKKSKEKPQSVKVEEAFPFKTPALLTSCPKFLGEPPKPVPTPFRLFTVKYRTTVETDAYGKALQRELREGWNKLTEEQKGMYVARCNLLKKEFEHDVKAYVREMDPKKRSLYLGFNRVTLYKFFGNRDVFADEFPNSKDYPVFVKEPKPSASPSKPRPAPETHQSDPEEEEEEEEEDLPTPKKLKRLSPQIYTALASAPPQPSSKGSKVPQSTPSPKKKAPPPLSESEEEEEEEEEEEPPPPPAPSPKKKGKAPSPPPVMSESEEEEEEEEEEPPPPPAPSPKKKGKAPSPPPVMSESEEEEEEEEEEDFFRSKSKPQQKVQKSLPASRAVPGLRDFRKMKPQPQPQPPPSESGSELTSDESEEDVLPAWATPSPRHAATKRK